jgi:hypothetical protein
LEGTTIDNRFVENKCVTTQHPISFEKKEATMRDEGVILVAIKCAWIMLLGIILIGMSAVMPYNSYSHHIVRDLGIAVLVAYVVIVTIEHRQRRELSRSIHSFLGSTNEKIFQTILGIEFPQGMFNFVRDTVMRGTFYRTETQINYWIKENGPEGVILELDASHVVCNLSGGMQTYEAPFFVEKDLNSEGTANPAVELHVDGKIITEQELRKADAQWDDTDDFTRFIYKLEIAPKQKYASA